MRKQIKLKNRWDNFIISLGGNNNPMPWSWIEKAYSEPHRKFHTLDHVKRSLDWLDQLAWTEQFKRNPQSGFDFSVMEMVLWCQYIVYNPLPTGNNGNNYLSTKMALNICGLLGLSSSFKAKVRIYFDELVESKCKNFLTKDIPTLSMLDIDYNFFVNDNYLQLEADLQEEYSWMPKEDYLNSRKEYLQCLLKEGIYLTTDVFKQYEPIARKNIEMFLAESSCK